MKFMHLTAVVIAVVAGLFFLSGCTATQIAGKAYVASEAAAEAIGDYVEENWNDRKKVREECRRIAFEEVEQLVDEKKFKEARELLAKIYPPLLTTEILREKLEAGNTLHLCPVEE